MRISGILYGLKKRCALLVAMSTLAAVCPMALTARNIVVCVGIADYPGVANDLRVSANDAMTVYNLYKTNGGTQATYLLNSSATVSKVCSAMQNLFSQAAPSDAIVLFFSGHGVPGGLVCYDGFLDYQRVYSIMKSSRATKKIIFADACFSGKMRTNKKHDNSMSQKNVMLFLSSRSGEKSYETPAQSGKSNSLFTLYLVQGLRGAADSNNDKIVTAKELFAYVHNAVTRSSGKAQHPVMWGKFNDRMAVMSWK